MELVEDQAQSGAPLLAATRPRLRPGDRPVWIDASPWVAQWDCWRAASGERGLALDALLGIELEYALVVEALGRSDAAALLASASEEELHQPRLAPSAELRVWVALLLGRERRPPVDDELPEVVVAERLLQQTGHIGSLDRAAQLRRLEQAIRAEAVAARRGLTLESWALRATLAGG